jgi:hypothetical protein
VNLSRPRTVLVALVALTSLAACGSDAEPGPTAEETSPETTSETASEPVELVVDGSAAGKCAAPNAETLASFDTAFAGTVTSVDDGTATLEVDQWYAGTDTDSATVTVAAPTQSLRDLLMAVDFQEGKSYLVSATGGRVTLCGFTAEQNPQLQAIYDEAFTG